MVCSEFAEFFDRENKIDVFICVGELSKYSYDVSIDGDCECYYFKNNDELLENINGILRDDDMVLVKGSHGMKLIDVVNYLKNRYK